MKADLALSRRSFVQLSSVAALATTVGCNSQRSSEVAKDESATPTSTGSEPPAGQKIPGPVPGTRLSEGYVSQMGRSIYFWAWPMMNIHNRRVTFEKLPGQGYLG